MRPPGVAGARCRRRRDRARSARARGERAAVDRDLVRAPARVLARGAVAHTATASPRPAPAPVRCARARRRRRAPPARDGQHEWCHRRAARCRERRRERRAARPVGHLPAAVEGEDPARRGGRVAHHRDTRLPEEPPRASPDGPLACSSSSTPSNRPRVRARLSAPRAPSATPPENVPAERRWRPRPRSRSVAEAPVRGHAGRGEHGRGVVRLRARGGWAPSAPSRPRVRTRSSMRARD